MRRFRPSPQQLAYLAAWLDPKTPKSISGIAIAIGVPRRTIYNWLESPDFLSWFDHEVERNVEALWRPVLHRVAELALQGSIEHAKLLAQIRGALHPHVATNHAVNVIIGIPRPKAADASGEEL